MHGKMRRLGVLSAVLLVALYMSAIWSGQALASPVIAQAHPAGVASSGSLLQTNAQAQAYWTPERMSSARQADVLLRSARLTTHMSFPYLYGGTLKYL